jgi:hypothetical protein
MDEQKKPPTPPNPVHQPGTGKGEEKVKSEGKEPGRKDTGTAGKANRPTGKSTARDSTGVNPKEPVDPQSPHLPTP